MPNAPYYQSPEWKRLRNAVWKRARGRCENCGAPGKTVDHIVPRRAGGADSLANLRLLCTVCDNRIKEAQDGTRRGAGTLPGCDSAGMPNDAQHPFWGGAASIKEAGGRSNSQAIAGGNRAGRRIATKFAGGR